MIVLRVRGAQEPCVPSIAPSKPPVTSPSHPHPRPHHLPLPSWPSRPQWGGGHSLRAKYCTVGFLQLLMFRFQAAPTQFLLFKTSDSLRAKTHNPANGHRGKEKKVSRKGGRVLENSVPLCVMSCLSLEKREEEDSRPPSADALILRGSISVGGLRWLQRQRPVGRVAREDLSEPCCCFGPRFVSSERSFQEPQHKYKRAPALTH